MSDGTPKWADLYGIDPDWPVSDTERENHVLRRILTDLIAELREWSDSELLNPDTELHVNRMADRAEARLREVGDE